MSQKGDKCSEIAKGNFQKAQNNTARLSDSVYDPDKSQYCGCIIHHCYWINSYWIISICGLPWRFSVSSFCEFLKITFCIFTAFFSFLPQANRCLFFRLCLIRSTLACTNMIKFDEMEFSEHVPEEVIIVFWRLVYYYDHSCQKERLQNIVRNSSKWNVNEIRSWFHTSNLYTA